MALVVCVKKIQLFRARNSAAPLCCLAKVQYDPLNLFEVYQSYALHIWLRIRLGYFDQSYSIFLATAPFVVPRERFVTNDPHQQSPTVTRGVLATEKPAHLPDAFIAVILCSFL